MCLVSYLKSITRIRSPRQLINTRGLCCKKLALFLFYYFFFFFPFGKLDAVFFLPTSLMTRLATSLPGRFALAELALN